MPKTKQSRKKKPDLSLTMQDSSEQSNSCRPRSFELRAAEAFEILKGSNNPSQISYRDKEIDEIKNCIENLINDTTNNNKCKVLMLTGSPGAGKTLCANFILKKMPYKIINLNANLVKNLKQVQRILAEELLPE